MVLVVLATIMPVGVAARGVPETDKAEAATFGDYPADQRIPFHPDVVKGRLDNGLAYYILENSFPENRATLRLFVDAGSIQETESQRGLAHYVEHMAFNGTAEFEENELVGFLEGLGIQFGPDVNAYTSYDETVYMLDVPTDNPEAFRQGFRVMEQWAHAIEFDPEAVERERGVIVEEWRSGRGASQRMLDQHLPVLFGDSRYASRRPIGEIDRIRTATAEDLRQYYDRWYRPDNMVFIVVGDFNASDVEERIRRLFGPIQRPDSPLDRPVYHVETRPDRRVSVASDPEAPYSSVSVYGLEEPYPFETVRDYRDFLVRNVYASVVNERLRELSRRENSPILQAGVGWTRYLRSLTLEAASAIVADRPVSETVSALLTEVERMRRHGVTESELERATRRMIESMDNRYTNRETIRSDSLASELLRHVTEGEAVPGIKYEYELYQELVPTISVTDVDAIARGFAPLDSVVLLASLAEEDAGNVSGEELNAAVKAVTDAEIPPPDPEAETRELMTRQPQMGTIVDRWEHQELGSVSFSFSNGTVLHVLPTDLKEDEVLFRGFSPGGLSLVEDELVPAARMAASVTFNSGVGPHSITDLEKILAGTSVSLSGSINQTSETISGSARSEELELLMQLLHLSFTAPRVEDAILENEKRRIREQVEGARRSPRGQFSLKVQELFANGDPRLTPPEPETWGQVSAEQIRQVFRNRFGNAADFAFFVAGSVDPDAVAALASRYIASLPSSATAVNRGSGSDAADRWIESARSTGYGPFQGRIEELVRAGSEPVAQVAAVLTGSYEWSQLENHRFTSMIDLLEIRLREQVREAAGGTYGVGVFGLRSREPREEFTIQIAFGCDPEQVDQLTELALSVVENATAAEPTEEELGRIQAQQREEYAELKQVNSYWISNMVFSVQHNRDFSAILEYPDLIDSLTAEDIRATAEKYLSTPNRAVVKLLPAQRPDQQEN